MYVFYFERSVYTSYSVMKPSLNSMDSARMENLPVATRVADSVVCLPMYHSLTEGEIEKVLINIAL